MRERWQLWTQLQDIHYLPTCSKLFIARDFYLKIEVTNDLEQLLSINSTTDLDKEECDSICLESSTLLCVFGFSFIFWHIQPFLMFLITQIKLTMTYSRNLIIYNFIQIVHTTSKYYNSFRFDNSIWILGRFYNISSAR